MNGGDNKVCNGVSLVDSIPIYRGEEPQAEAARCDTSMCDAPDRGEVEGRQRLKFLGSFQLVLYMQASS